MRAGQSLHIVTDANGNIIAASVVEDASTHATDAQVRLMALADQRVVVVQNPSGFDALETHEDFHRLINDFHVPHGTHELVRKRADEDTCPGL